MDDLPTSEQLIASAAKFLIEGKEDQAASVLLSCRIDTMHRGEAYWQSLSSYQVHPVDIGLRAPRVAWNLLKDHSSDIREQVKQAIEAVLPSHHELNHLDVRAELVTIEPDWHAELVERARGKTVDNQAVQGDGFRLWQNFRFRSVTEVKVAEALDRAGVLFLPLCKARLNGPRGRVNREPDFLVCKDGKWGILEVDGEPYHPPQRTVHDHQRDRLFQQHGIRLAQHYDSTDCYVTPDKVVAEFLALLDRAY